MTFTTELIQALLNSIKILLISKLQSYFVYKTDLIVNMITTIQNSIYKNMYTQNMCVGL